MLYLLYGSRRFIKNESVNIKSALLAKRPDAIFLAYDGTVPEQFDLEETASGQGLFQARYVVELFGMFGGDYFSKPKEAIVKIKESENIFLVLEEKLPKKTLDLLKESAEKTTEEKASSAQTVKEFSAFSLADALVARDKKGFGLYFEKHLIEDTKSRSFMEFFFGKQKQFFLHTKLLPQKKLG
jgi:DNA polymerase III delta subunit